MTVYEILSLIINFLIFVAGLSAIVIYEKQKHHTLKTAATLILEQIDSAEEIIGSFREKYTHSPQKIIDDDSLYLSKEIPYSGAWEQYQYLMIRKLSHNEILLLNDFFGTAYRIEKARADLVYSFKLTWNNKSLTTQLMGLKVFDPTFDYKYKENENPSSLYVQFINANNSSYSFTPNIAYKLLYAELDMYKQINGTSAYTKLHKLSYRK